MRNSLSGYWIFTWIGMLANISAIPFIAFVVSSGPPLQWTNLWVAIFLAWPAAIVGIVAASGLFAERRWGVIMSIVALSMAVSGTLPYGIYRLIDEGKPLPLWHYLIHGNFERMIKEKKCVRNRVINEKQVKEKHLQKYIYEWEKF